MESKLNGLAISKGVSTDEVVRTIQALISAGYKGDELLEKIDEIYGVGARNNLLKTIDYEIPTERITVSIEYPQIFPSEKTKIGDILIGSNGYIGEITNLETDSNKLVSSITVLGLSYNIIENMLPDVSVEDNYKVLTVGNGLWSKDYISRTGKDFEICGNYENSVFNQGHLIFKNECIDEKIIEGITNRNIHVEPIFVPYDDNDDSTLCLRFSDDDDQFIRLSGIKDPINNQDVANKKYVDNHTPLFIVFSGTTEGGDAACDTDWDIIVSAVNSGRPIHARYLAKSFDNSNIYYDLNLSYSDDALIGSYIHIDSISDPASSYDEINVYVRDGYLEIYFTSV